MHVRLCVKNALPMGVRAVTGPFQFTLKTQFRLMLGITDELTCPLCYSPLWEVNQGQQ